MSGNHQITPGWVIDAQHLRGFDPAELRQNSFGLAGIIYSRPVSAAQDAELAALDEDNLAALHGAVIRYDGIKDSFTRARGELPPLTEQAVRVTLGEMTELTKSRGGETMIFTGHVGAGPHVHHNRLVVNHQMTKDHGMLVYSFRHGTIDLTPPRYDSSLVDEDQLQICVGNGQATAHQLAQGQAILFNGLLVHESCRHNPFDQKQVRGVTTLNP